MGVAIYVFAGSLNSDTHVSLRPILRPSRRDTAVDTTMGRAVTSRYSAASQCNIERICAFHSSI
jgi:hypothetical protein